MEAFTTHTCQESSHVLTHKNHAAPFLAVLALTPSHYKRTSLLFYTKAKSLLLDRLFNQYTITATRKCTWEGQPKIHWLKKMQGRDQPMLPVFTLARIRTKLMEQNINEMHFLGS